MNSEHSQKSVTGIGVTSVVAAVATSAGTPLVDTHVVTDTALLDQGRVFAEALRQAAPLAADGGPEALRMAEIIREGTARKHGLSLETATRMATSGRSVDGLLAGANPQGKAAEIVSIADYRAAHAGANSRVINQPEHLAANLHDIRVTPDSSSRKDLLFAFEAKSGKIVWKYNGQVKTGGAQYVTDTLVEMAGNPKYGKAAYVDARYVNADGSPRVANDAFSAAQAKRLRDADVQLRGFQGLESRAEKLMQDLEASKADGLDPVAREELRQLRDDVAAAYRGRNVFARVGGAAAVGAAAAAITALVVQLTTEGKVDVSGVGKAAGSGAALGAGSSVLDAALYHLGNRFFDLTPEVAKQFASNAVSAIFCLVAVGTDILTEVGAARKGDVTAEGALCGASLKVPLDILPLVLAPLGLPGVGLAVASQVGGRLVITKLRDADRRLEHKIRSNFAQLEELIGDAKRCTERCDQTDAIFASIMASTGATLGPRQVQSH
jgi:hypothetical protein